MKILAVEDDPVAGLLLESSLVHLGHEVVKAANGREAWDVLEREPIQFVVSDWSMPKMDGLELCRRVREEKSDYVYFILLTSRSASSENQDLALAAGVDDFLSKPVDVHELKVRLHVASRIISYTTHIEKLESFIPICSYCKKVRDDKNYWQQIEMYINDRTGSEFSHSICPGCYTAHITPQLEALRAKPIAKLTNPGDAAS